MAKYWGDNRDIESNNHSLSYDKLIQLDQCTCDKTVVDDLCDYCLKNKEESLQMNELSSSFFSRFSDKSVFSANSLMLFSIMLYSGNAVIIKKYILMGGTGPGFLFLRSIISIPFFLITYAVNYSKNKSFIALTENSKVNFIMITGCVAGAIRQALVPFIMNESEASTMGIISPSVPLVTAVISHLFNLERLTKITLLCLLISTSGLVYGLDLINKFNPAVHLTYYLLLLIPITKSFQVVFLKMSSDKFEGLQLLANQVIISVIVCLPTSLLMSIYSADDSSAPFEMLFDFTFKQFLCALYSVLAILFLAWRIQIYCLKILGATTVALFQTLRPFFTMILGSIVLDEEITVRKIIGSLILCVALVIYQKNRVRPPTLQH